jgi:hypothetical protein
MPWDCVSAVLATAVTLGATTIIAEVDRLKAQRDLTVQDNSAGGGRGPEELCLCLQRCSAADGIICNGDGSHFICNPCFQRHVQRCCSLARSASFARLGCRVYCPGRRCSAAPSEAASPEMAFSDRQIMRHVDDRTWQLLFAARQQAAQPRGLRELVAQPPLPDIPAELIAGVAWWSD